MKYKTALANVTEWRETPDGYNGDTQIIGISRIDGEIYAVWEHGCYRTTENSIENLPVVNEPDWNK
jgi:hypothetical protein